MSRSSVCHLHISFCVASQTAAQESVMVLEVCQNHLVRYLDIPTQGDAELQKILRRNRSCQDGVVCLEFCSAMPGTRKV